MWNEHDQTRWDELSRKRDVGTLTGTEQSEYDGLAARLAAEEWEQLSPALRVLDEEIESFKQARRTAERERSLWRRRRARYEFQCRDGGGA